MFFSCPLVHRALNVELTGPESLTGELAAAAIHCQITAANYIVNLPSTVKSHCCDCVCLQSWRLLCGRRLSRWSSVHLERPDGESGQNSGQEPQVRCWPCASLSHPWNVTPDQTECGDLNLCLFLQLSHQLRVLVTFRNVRGQCGERLQGHPLVRHLNHLKRATTETLREDFKASHQTESKLPLLWTRWTLKWLHVYVFRLSRSKLPPKRNQEFNSWHLEGKSKVVWIIYVCVQLE